MTVTELSDQQAQAMARQAVFSALFKVASTAELCGSEQAVAWAQSVLDDPQLLEAFASELSRRCEV